MTEVLTKRFWKDVKKTFQQAIDGEPPVDKAPAVSEPSTLPKPEAANTESATAHPSEG